MNLLICHMPKGKALNSYSINTSDCNDFNSHLNDTVSMATNHSDPVKPKLLSDFKKISIGFLSVMYFDFKFQN